VIPNSLKASLIRRLFVLLATILVTYLPSAHGQNGEDAAESSFVLSGNVINSVTREPVPRALVYSPDNRFATFTDDQGHFEFKIVFPGGKRSASGLQPNFFGPNTLMARKPGFLENESQNQIGPETRTVTLTLVPEALIVGRVNVAAANQADRITVEAYRRQVNDGRAHWVSTATVSTRSNGEFRIANLRAGTYKLFTGEMLDRDPLTFDPQGQAYGYPPIYYPAASDFGSAAPIVLEAGKTFQVELSPVLQAYYPVKIAITNAEAGAPLAVSVARQGSKGPGYSLGYDGESITGSLPNGTYTVEITRQGMPTATGIATISVHGAPLTNANISLIPSGSIPVDIKEDPSRAGSARSDATVRGGFGQLQLANVYLESADEFDQAGGGTLSPSRQPGENQVAIHGARPGRFWVHVNPFQPGDYVAAITAGGRDLLHNPLVVGLGGTTPPIEIMLRDDSATVEGTLDRPPSGTSMQPLIQRFGGAPSYSETRSGNYPAFVYAIPLPDSSGRFTHFGVEPDGTFHFAELAPGAYRLLAFDRQQPDLEYSNPDAMSGFDGKGPVVRLSPGGTERVRLTLIRSSE
jgi:hypothetical protein